VTRYDLAGAGAGVSLPAGTPFAASYTAGAVGREVLAARLALTDGLTVLRGCVAEMLVEMLSTVLRGDGGTSSRTRNRPHVNDIPIRHIPGGNTKPIGGRLAAPARPNGAPSPELGGDTEPLPRPAGTAATGLIGGVRDGQPAGQTKTGPPSAVPPGYPDRPDPTDAAAAVWTLVERAQAGEAEAFGLIYDRYVDTVFRFIYFRVGNRQLAEDLTSDTFLRALKRIGSFTWQGRDLGAWLVTIARNLVADHFKSGRYRLEVTTGDVLDADREDRGPEGSPESAVVDHITNVALLTAVKQLNPEQQECIVLRFLQGFSVAETAQAMGKNEGAIKALQYRAVRALARLLPDGFHA
jgi:RNA polymerase sigma-70 factor (ECF subfamily)